MFLLKMDVRQFLDGKHNSKLADSEYMPETQFLRFS